MRILVTGANGQLGQALQGAVRPMPGMEWHFHSRAELDISDPDMVDSLVRFLRPDIIINAAAYTAVDRAESEAEQAYRINRDGAGYLAQSGKAVGAKLIQISTDYVYDNGQAIPYLETDPVRPQGVYARSKRAGEEAVLQADPANMVIRTSWLYGPAGTNFLKTMIRLGREKPSIGVVFDQVGSPTCTIDLAEALVAMVQWIQDDPSGGTGFQGIFNYSNEGVCSWYDLAVGIMRYTGSSCEVRPIRSADYPTPASRPAYSVMDKARIKDTFGLQIAHWRDALERCIREMPKEPVA